MPLTAIVIATSLMSLKREAVRKGWRMVYIKTKNPTLDKFWWALQGKMLPYFMDTWSFYNHLVYSLAIWYMLWQFGIFFPLWYVSPRKFRHTCYQLEDEISMS
jgi:hypothetical protein